MPFVRVRFRLLMLSAATGFVVVALAIRAVGPGAIDSTGTVEQVSGTALYAALVYVGVLFLWPLRSPFTAGAIAWAWCWVIEVFQLTGIPAELSGRSLLARLVLGVRFDPVDLFWYPAGIVPLVALHWFWARRATPPEEVADVDQGDGGPRLLAVVGQGGGRRQFRPARSG